MIGRCKHFFKALWVFLLMYHDGFWFSKNDHWTGSIQSGATHWGFYRFWHGKKELNYDMSPFDLDFNFGYLPGLMKQDETYKNNYFHVHRGPSDSFFCRHF